MKGYFWSIKTIFRLCPILIIFYLVLNTLIYILHSFEVVIVQKIIVNITSKELLYAIIFVALFIISLFIVKLHSSIMSIFKMIIQNKVSVTLYEKVYYKLASIEIIKLDNSNYLNTINEAKQAIDFKLCNAFYLIADIFGIIVSLVSLSIIVMNVKGIYLLIFLGMSIMQVVFIYFNTKESIELIKMQNKKKRKLSYFTNLVQERDSAKEIRSYKIGNWLENKRELEFNEIKEEHLQHSRKWAVINICWAFVMFSIEGVLYVLLYFQSIDSSITIDQVILIIQSNASFITNMVSLFSQISSIGKNNIYTESLRKILEDSYKPQNVTISNKESLELIELHDVYFGYGKANVLKNINMCISRGEVLVLVGENGSGKSTLSKLIAGMLEPQQGYSVVYTQKISAVFQDFAKFKLSLRENIGFGEVAYIADDKKIIESIKLTKLDYIIPKLPEYLETELGKEYSEKGIDLSGGEWQKIAISRCVFRDADLIIFDEPTSALDAIAEKKMFEILKQSLVGKGMIMVSHRVGITHLADRIIYLEGGKIVEQGSHKELMKLNKRYYKFYKEQSIWYEN